MNKDLVIKNVSRYIDLEPEEQTLFLSFLRPKSLKKKELLLRAGEVCKETAFVVDGALKSFTVDQDGTEHILNFALQDWWIADLYSLITEKPVVLNIEAIPDTEVLLLSRQNQEVLCKRLTKFERFFRILTEKALVANHQRLIENLSSTAEERYLHFIEKYPAIPVCVPQHSIASYLGITPEFLSKIRHRLSKKK